MKKILAIVLCVALVLSLAACGGSSTTTSTSTATESTESGDKVVKIGVYEPLSGDNGAGGKQEVLGMQYANAVCPTVEIGGETYQVELVISDNESSTEKAVSAASNLVASGVSVVLGSYGSAVAIAGSDTFAEANIPCIGVTCTNALVTQGNDHYFRICFLDPFQGTVQANLAKDEIGATVAYCIGQQGNDYDTGLINNFKTAAEDLGMTVVAEYFPEGNSDFTSYLTNAKNAGAEVIFAPTSISYAQLIVEQAKDMGIPICAPDTWDSNVVLEATQGTDLVLYVSTFYAEGGDPEFEENIKAWINGNDEAKTNNGGNDMLSAVTVMGYDAYFVALEALKAAGSTDPADVLAALPNVTYTGVTGAIAFDEVGDAIRTEAFIKRANTTDNVWDFVSVQTVD